MQHQKGLSDDGFEQRYPDEAACRKAWLAWRWLEGFKCPRCAGTTYCEIQGRQLLQCRQYSADGRSLERWLQLQLQYSFARRNNGPT